VKDTTAWAIGRVCSLHGSIIATGLGHVMQVLLESSSDSTKVSSYVCYALHNLFDTFRADSENQTGSLSPYFAPTLQALINVTGRSDGDQHNLRISAYESIAVLIGAAPKDCIEYVKATIPHFVAIFESTIKNKASSEHRNDLQSSLCGVLQAIIRRFNKQDIEAYKDKFMECFLGVPASHEKFTTASEDALMSISALSTSLEGDFERYLSHTMSFVLLGLKNFEDYTTCAVSVGLVGDVCRAVGKKISPYCDEIVSVLLTDLQNSQLHRDVKPPILSCFGDIALAIGGDFTKYLSHVIVMLQQASLTKVDESNYDLVDYLNQLRDGIFEAYIGIIIGLKEHNSDAVLQHVSGILEFIHFVWQDPNKSESVIKSILGVLGDIAATYGTKVTAQFTQNTWIKAIILESLKNEESDIQETAQWCKEVLGKIIRFER